MTTLTCKGYTATVVTDPDTGVFHCQVTDMGALLTIAGCSMDEVKAAFEEALADYEVRCRERDKMRRAQHSAKASQTPLIRRRSLTG